MKSNSTGQVDRAGEVAHEHERALEHTHEERRTVRVVGGDLLAEAGDALAELLGGHHHLAQGVRHGRHGTAWCRRPPSRHDPPSSRELRGATLAPGDREDALHLGERRRRRAEPAPHGPPGERGWASAIAAHPGRIGPRGVSSASASSSSRSASARSTAACRVSTGTRSRCTPAFERGQHLVADPVAPEGRVVVRRVGDRLEAPRDDTAPALRSRRTPSSGRTTGPRRAGIPASPLAALPRSRLRSTVSAWSSAVCATRTAVAPASARAASSAA